MNAVSGTARHRNKRTMGRARIAEHQPRSAGTHSRAAGSSGSRPARLEDASGAATRPGKAPGPWPGHLRTTTRQLRGRRSGASRVSCTPGFVCAVAPGGGCCG